MDTKYICPVTFIRHSNEEGEYEWEEYYEYHDEYYEYHDENDEHEWDFYSEDILNIWNNKMTWDQKTAHMDFLCDKSREGRPTSTQEIQLEFEEKYPHLPIYWGQTQ